MNPSIQIHTFISFYFTGVEVKSSVLRAIKGLHSRFTEVVRKVAEFVFCEGILFSLSILHKTGLRKIPCLSYDIFLFIM